jgi:hypothetical protein
VRVTESFFIERYSHVMHIVSNVVGDAPDGLDPVDVLMAALPADVGVSIEAPTARNAHLPALERARLAFLASRSFMDRQAARAHMTPQ